MVRASASRFSAQRGAQVGAVYPVRPGRVSPARGLPAHVQPTEYHGSGSVSAAPEEIWLFRDEDDQALLRQAARFARDMLARAGALVRPGATTEEIDAALHEAITDAGACPSPLNYNGFPKSICTSVNEVACHGIPDDRPLEDGDLISIDVSAFLNGVHGDNCATFPVGHVDDEGQRLIAATEEALALSIDRIGPGVALNEVGRAIREVADKHRYGIARCFSGHGVGPWLHMLPTVEHDRNNFALPLESGMVFTIEPILTEGTGRVHVWPDKWTACTLDGGRAAQFEHTVHITDTGVEILTLLPGQDPYDTSTARLAELPP